MCPTLAKCWNPKIRVIFEALANENSTLSVHTGCTAQMLEEQVLRHWH